MAINSLFERVIKINQPIFIFYRSKSILSRLIRKIGKTKYSHVSLLLPDGIHTIESAWNTPLSIEHYSYKKSDYDAYKMKDALSEEQAGKLLEYIRDSIKTNYDFVYIFSRGLNRLLGTPIYNLKSKINCDEFLVSAFNHIGVNLIDEGSMLTPQAISESNKLVKINI